MPIVFRWIFTGCLQRGLATMTVLLGIFIIVEAFDKARFLGHGLDGAMMVEYILLKMPFMISGFMPVIVLLACSVFLTELSHHHELAALRAAGLGLNKLLTPLMAVAALAASLSFAIGQWVTPITNTRLDFIERVHIHHQPETSRDVQWLRDGHRFFRLTPLGDQHFKMMMIETDDHGRWLQRLDAADAIYADHAWVLSDVDISAPGGTSGLRFDHQDDMHIDSAVGPSTASPPEPRHMGLLELGEYARNLQRAGMNASSYVFTFHRKLAAPLACFIMAILALALCMHMSSRVSAASWGLAAAICLGLAFYIFGDTSNLLATGDRLPAGYAAWLPNLSFGGIAVFLLIRKEGK
ncbi:MAG TPA: LptF/LptG family permease [Mariprofundaceae bacterium]|nr:LptF/LptG family permease [Mariprofundaceae bacterium]